MPSHLSPVLFDSSAARISIFQMSNSLGTGLLDDYIGLVVNQKLRTELFVLSFLLKDQVYPADLWELVGERSIEAKQEETLRLHQSSCTGGDDGSHAIVERLLIEERKKRCQIEVSLYSQAIERLEQYRTPLTHVNDPAKREIMTPSAMSKKEVAPLTCSIATQEMCEDWLMRNEAHLIPAAEPFIENYSPLDGSTVSILDQLTTAQEEKSKSAILNHITPSLPLLSTWVTARAQEALYVAFKIELASQAELMARSFANKRDSAYMRPLERDLFTLQAKMRRAEAEIELYTLAIENTHEFNFSDNSSSTSSDQSIPLSLSKEVYRRQEDDVDDDTDEDYQFW
ncbi:uncharacterized protein BJ212DRAFT_1361415 [Suillus subaureus]|uniref:Uncharacterized protein n=1 Tax=Suillus subaureus TaxID=48587 RepID=A0A9P7JCQ6_9AGAM|nr:uncharacterized protein BJ212DRAFT_1361415 [Suillus subaureus]KAG1814688.1 hypothetical protein BJ212DRAFT_1361415 [Suillus subaureus]